jgi:asparagine synthase (glutamine-hydrolysing)
MACFSFHDMDFTSEQGTHSGTIEDAFRHDLTTYLPGDILTKVDRASMSNGLEIRSPFLDMDFASFCISLPYRIKISSSSDKLILRQAFSHLWPHTIQTRTKQGFGAPVQLWLEKSEMTDLKQEYLFDKSKTVFSLLDYNSCLRSINNNPYKTWTLLNLSLWLEKHNCDFS